MKKFQILLVLLLFPWFCISQDLDPKSWPHLKGYWKFQNVKNLTRATVGSNLLLTGTHTSIAGPAYGDTAIRIAVGSYYKCKHGISPNGGGDSVNQYTLMFDFKVLNFNRWHTFFQTDTTNKNDGECFIRPSSGSNPGRIGTATTGYTPTAINPKQWYRLVISVNLNNFYRYYLNGQLVLEGDTQEVDGRFALLPQILFFADDNQEDDTIDIASVAIFDTCLSSKDIARIGTIEPCIANPPKVNLGNDTALCYNSSLSLSAGLNFAKYQWSTGDKMPFALIETSSLGLGKKKVWVSVTDYNGCTGSDTLLLDVLNLPALNLGADTAICQGRSVTLKAGTDPSNQYLWRYFPSGNVLSTANSITTDSGGRYMARVTSKAGCMNSDTIRVSIYSNPPKPGVTIKGKTSFCEGDSVKLSGPDGYAAYIWTNNSLQKELSLHQSSRVQLKVRDANGCESDFSDTVKIEVFSNPPLPTFTIQGDTVFCEGDSAELSAPAGYKSYHWSNGEKTQTLIIKNSTWLYLYLVDQNNCQSPLSRTITFEVKPAPPKPLISLTGNKEFCEGDSAALSVAGTYPFYTWSDNSKSKEIQVKVSGIYKARVGNTEGCYSLWSDGVSINVNPNPPKPKVQKGSADSLQSSIVAESYQWVLGSKLLAENSRSVLPLQSGYYKVKIANKACWSALSDSFYYKSAGISRHLPHALVIFPNPTSDQIRVIDPLYRGSGSVIIGLSNLEGDELQDFRIGAEELKRGIHLDLSEFKAGTYFLRINTSSGTQTYRILKL